MGTPRDVVGTLRRPGRALLAADAEAMSNGRPVTLDVSQVGSVPVGPVLAARFTVVAWAVGTCMDEGRPSRRRLRGCAGCGPRSGQVGGATHESRSRGIFDGTVLVAAVGRSLAHPCPAVATVETADTPAL